VKDDHRGEYYKWSIFFSASSISASFHQEKINIAEDNYGNNS